MPDALHLRARRLPQDRADLLRARGHPPPRPVGEGRDRPARAVAQGRRGGAALLRRPGGVRRSGGRRLPLQRDPLRGADPRRRQRPRLLGAHRHHRSLPHQPRHRRAEAALAARLPSPARSITAIAMTEPGAGSDLQGIRTTAVDKGDHYLLNGSKTFISNGINADLVIVVARTDPEAGHKGISLLVVERGMEGFERGRNLDKIGLHAQDTAELSFTDVVVPKENLLGEEGEGFIYLMMNLPQERLIIAAQAVAACRGDRRDVPRLRQDPRGVRQADRQVPAQPVPDRRDGHRDQDRAGLPRRLPAQAPRRQARPPSTRRWPSGGAPSCRTSWSTRASSCTAATAT